MITFLNDDNLEFPDINQALIEPDGLLCAGSNLEVDTLLKAYKSGIFPWFDDTQPILWWSPNPRMVIVPEELYISKSMKKFINKQRNNTEIKITVNEAFKQVLDNCSNPRDKQEGTWITHEMKDAYYKLKMAGYAYSIEVWENTKLIGGLYGAALGRIFFGESMFSLKANASKLALISLIQTNRYNLIDCQFYTKHLASLGAGLIPRAQYIENIKHLSKKDNDILTSDAFVIE